MSASNCSDFVLYSILATSGVWIGIIILWLLVFCKLSKREPRDNKTSFKKSQITPTISRHQTLHTATDTIGTVIDDPKRGKRVMSHEYDSIMKKLDNVSQMIEIHNQTSRQLSPHSNSISPVNWSNTNMNINGQFPQSQITHALSDETVNTTTGPTRTTHITPHGTRSATILSSIGGNGNNNINNNNNTNNHINNYNYKHPGTGPHPLKSRANSELRIHATIPGMQPVRSLQSLVSAQSVPSRLTSRKGGQDVGSPTETRQSGSVPSLPATPKLFLASMASTNVDDIEIINLHKNNNNRPQSARGQRQQLQITRTRDIGQIGQIGGYNNKRSGQIGQVGQTGQTGQVQQLQQVQTIPGVPGVPRAVERSNNSNNSIDSGLQHLFGLHNNSLQSINNSVTNSINGHKNLNGIAMFNAYIDRNNGMLFVPNQNYDSNASTTTTPFPSHTAHTVINDNDIDGTDTPPLPPATVDSNINNTNIKNIPNIPNVPIIGNNNSNISNIDDANVMESEDMIIVTRNSPRNSQQHTTTSIIQSIDLNSHPSHKPQNNNSNHNNNNKNKNNNINIKQSTLPSHTNYTDHDHTNILFNVDSIDNNNLDNIDDINDIDDDINNNNNINNTVNDNKQNQHQRPLKSTRRSSRMSHISRSRLSESRLQSTNSNSDDLSDDNDNDQFDNDRLSDITERTNTIHSGITGQTGQTGATPYTLHTQHTPNTAITTDTHIKHPSRPSLQFLQIAIDGDNNSPRTMGTTSHQIGNAIDATRSIQRQYSAQHSTQHSGHLSIATSLPNLDDIDSNGGHTINTINTVNTMNTLNTINDIDAAANGNINDDNHINNISCVVTPWNGQTTIHNHNSNARLHKDNLSGISMTSVNFNNNVIEHSMNWDSLALNETTFGGININAPRIITNVNGNKTQLLNHSVTVTPTPTIGSNITTATTGGNHISRHQNQGLNGISMEMPLNEEMH